MKKDKDDKKIEKAIIEDKDWGACSKINKAV